MRMFARPDADYEDTGGVGGTLAGNPLSVAAMRATLERRADRRRPTRTRSRSPTRFADGVRAVVAAHGLPRGTSRQLGCRAEYALHARAAAQRHARPTRPPTTTSSASCTSTR